MKELRFVVGGLAAATLLSLIALAALAAETVTVVAGHHPGFGRIAFRWAEPVDFTLAREGDAVVIRFARPMEAKLGRITAELDDYVAAARSEEDGKAVRLELKRPFELRSFKDGPSVVALDILGSPDKAATTAAPAGKRAEAKPRKTEPAARATGGRREAPHAGAPDGAPSITARLGEHKGFDRIVFDWPTRVGFRVSREGDRAIVTFDRPARIDLARLKRDPSRFAPAVESEATGEATRVTLHLVAGVRLRELRDGPRIAIDLLAPDAKADSKRAAKARKAEPITADAGKAAKAARIEDAPAGPAPVMIRVGPQAAPHATGAPTPIVNPPQAAAEAAKASSTNPAPAAGPPAAAKPKGGAADDVLAVGYKADDSGASLSFPWSDAVGLAVFRRADKLWLVFDRPSRLDLARLPAGGDGKSFTGAAPLAHLRATILRLSVPAGVVAASSRDGFTWTVTLAKGDARPAVPIAVLPQPQAPGGPRLHMPVENPAFPLEATDPDAGDKLVVVPVAQPGWGIFDERAYVEFHLLPSAQGVVVEPRRDGVIVNSQKDGIDIMGEKGLLLSAATEPASPGIAFGNAETTPALFDLAAWRGSAKESEVERKQALQLKLSQASPKERNALRLELARFNFAAGMTAEAEGLIAMVAKEEPARLETPELRTLRGALAMLRRDYTAATKLLGGKDLATVPEAALWRGAVDAEQGDFAAAEREFVFGGALIGNYPHPIQARLGLLAAETLLAQGDAPRAQALIEGFEKTALSSSERGRIAYLRGRAAMLADRPGDALPLFEQAERSDDPLGAAKAKLARISLMEKLGKLAPKDAVKQLDALRYAWRGDSFELDLLDELGRLYLSEGDYRNGLITLRRAVTYFPDSPRAKPLAALMANSFIDLFVHGAADKLSPLDAVAIYDEFKELAPTGHEGDEVALHLADRLVAVDLLERAAKLLDGLVRTRLSGAEKAEAGLRLAKIELLDERPDLALQGLAASAVDGIPDALATARRHLEARALALSGKVPDALAKLEGDDSLEAAQIRAEAYWKSHDWANAAQAYGRILDGLPQPGALLTAAQGNTALRLAVALTMLGDQGGIDALRARFSRAIPSGAARDGFLVVTSGTGQPGESFRKLANTVAEVERFKAFMNDYRKEFLERAKPAPEQVASQ